MKVYKEIKIYVCDAEQSVNLVNNETDNHIIMKLKDEVNNKYKFDCYLSIEEAEQLAKELISFAQYLKS